MNEQDVRAAMKTYRWSFICRMRRNHAYIYSARKVGGKREERYIAPLKGLEALTVEALIAKLARWFAGREEIDIVDVGVSDKQGLGFLIIEWLECEIDPLFLAILRDEEMVGDFTVYGRNLEV